MYTLKPVPTGLVTVVLPPLPRNDHLEYAEVCLDEETRTLRNTLKVWVICEQFRDGRPSRTTWLFHFVTSETSVSMESKLESEGYTPAPLLWSPKTWSQRVNGLPLQLLWLESRFRQLYFNVLYPSGERVSRPVDYWRTIFLSITKKGNTRSVITTPSVTSFYSKWRPPFHLMSTVKPSVKP